MLLQKLKYVFVMAAFLLGAVTLPLTARAEGTPEQAMEMAKKAAQYVRDNGTEAATAEFNKPESEFIMDDLYVFVVNDAGEFVAHPIKPALVGKNMMDLKDVEGTPLVKLFTEVEDEGWVEYKWPHPATKQVAPKKSYIINVDGYRVGVGAYYQE